MSLAQQYNLHDINWKTRDKQTATPQDTWAWEFIHTIDNHTQPILAALVEDIQELGHPIDIPPYQITISKNKFLHRTLQQ